MEEYFTFIGSDMTIEILKHLWPYEGELRQVCRYFREVLKGKYLFQIAVKSGAGINYHSLPQALKRARRLFNIVNNLRICYSTEWHRFSDNKFVLNVSEVSMGFNKCIY